MIPGLEPTQVTVAMRALEAGGRLRRANERVAEFQSRIPIAALWGDGDKASADMMSLDVSRNLWNARVDPRRRTYAAGLYTHVRDRWPILSQVRGSEGLTGTHGTACTRSADAPQAVADVGVGGLQLGADVLERPAMRAVALDAGCAS